MTAILAGSTVILYLLGAYQMYSLLPSVEAKAEALGFYIPTYMKVVVPLIWPYMVIRELFYKEPK